MTSHALLHEAKAGNGISECTKLKQVLSHCHLFECIKSILPFGIMGIESQSSTGLQN